MTQETLWREYCKRNPSFAGNGEVTMTAAGLKKLFDQTWQMAESHGEANEKARVSRLTRAAGGDPFDGMFDGIFNTKK